MKYLKELLISIKEIVIVYLLQYIFLIGICFLYLIINKEGLEIFISTTGTILVCLVNVAIIIYFIRKRKIRTKNISIVSLYNYLFLGISIALFMNMFFFYFNQINEVTNVNIYLIILSSGVIGPIIEEILFRYILLNKLLEFNNKKTAIILSSLIFALFHNSLTGIIYAFILGLILNIIYSKEKNILIPIIIHMGANVIVIFIFSFNFYILILSIMGLIINYLIIRKKVSNERSN